MNILKITNTYKPLVGGLEKSISSFVKEYRALWHRVVVVAHEYPDMKPEEDVIRIPAMQHFNGSDFSVQMPNQGILVEFLGDFRPDSVHSQSLQELSMWLQALRTAERQKKRNKTFTMSCSVKA
jgi:hypothetical protein